MSDFKPRPGTFLPYLEAENKRQEQRPKPSPLTLLEILSVREMQSWPIFDLQAQSATDPNRYGEVLKSLVNARYIEIQGEAPEQTVPVHLTGAGAQVVKLAKPA